MKQFKYIKISIFFLLCTFFIFNFSTDTVYGAITKDNVNDEIPTSYIPLYQKAAKKYGISWFLLASVHNQETTFSSAVKKSSAGAIGHAQFMRCTWVGWGYSGCKGTKGDSSSINDSVLMSPESIKQYKGYGIDANLDGKSDPWDLVDAIFTMANYLNANGSTSKGDNTDKIKKAIMGYNHSESYYKEVKKRFERYEKGWEGTSPNGTNEFTWKTIEDNWAKDYFLQTDGTSQGDLGNEVSTSSELKGSTYSYVNPFNDYKSDLNTIGVNDGTNYDTSFTQYKLNRYIGVLKDYMTVISYALAILVATYMFILWLSVLLARTHFQAMYKFTLTITFNTIDAFTDLGKLGKITIIALLIIAICLSGLIPQIFGLIFWLFSKFIINVFRL